MVVHSTEVMTGRDTERTEGVGGWGGGGSIWLDYTNIKGKGTGRRERRSVPSVAEGKCGMGSLTDLLYCTF